MLQSLSIQNYALIEELELAFRPHLTTITGETGSGKSILLGALGLILGERADTTVLRDPDQKCIVEGYFELTEYDKHFSNLSNEGKMNNFFDRNDLDYDAITTIRREIAPSGRSRAFINDTPVTLAQLKELTSQLVDIHSQHETLTLNNNNFQREVVDVSAGNMALLTQYQGVYRSYKSKTEALTQLREEESRSRLDLDYFTFQRDELQAAELEAGQEKQLEEELEMLSNSEDIKRSLHQIVGGFTADSGNVMDDLNAIRQQLHKLTRMSSALSALDERLTSAVVELEDIAGELEQFEENLIHDPQRLEEVSARLDQLNSLMNKHRVQSVEELLHIQQELEGKVSGIGSLATEITTLEAAIEKDRQQLDKWALELHQKREKSLPQIVKKVHKMLAELAMPHAELQIECEQGQELGPNGYDRIRFLFKANKGGVFRELGKVASGGELSRLMLSIKALMADMKTLPTVILDEIDTGISGDVADKAGNIMRKMAANMQVLCITHLPQIASKGNHHLKVRKEVHDDTTVTRVHVLSEAERVEEIAKMLSGKSMSEAAMQNAKVLLGTG